MCFSASASFTASAVLAVTGVTALCIAKEKRYWMFASIPFLFALQQFFEGIVWLTHPGSEHGLLHYVAAHIFLMFAFLVWPIWIPIALRIAEIIRARQKVLNVLIVLGVLVSAFGLYQLIFYRGAMAVVPDNHLQYLIGARASLENLYLLIYVLATILPFLMSSIRWTTWLGLLLLASLVVTCILMAAAVISVWCFFSAVLSVFVVLIVWRNQR